jgi:glyoxylase-like metal-dependent hydrolase (beta-lactamase superfamily II)
VRTPTRVILVDTGAGNDKDRPNLPLVNHLNEPFLDRLKAAGVRPEDVNLVLHTHLHVDHVGWNTKKIDLWQLHRIDTNVPRDEQFGAVRQLLDDGIRRFYRTFYGDTVKNIVRWLAQQ